MLIFTAALLFPVTVFASDVSDAQYYGDIVASNNSTAASNVCGNVTIGTDDLITAGILNSSANNCAVQSSIGADVPFMPGYGGNPWIVFFDSIGAYSSSTVKLYTGNVTGGEIAYFPGTTGMSVNDTMTEPGAAFEIDMTGIMPALTAPTLTTPVIRAQNNGAATAAIVPVTMPAGLASGDLLFVFIDLYDVGGAGSPVITTPAGFTQMWHTAESAVKRYGAYYKVATGAEASPTNFTIDRNSYYSFRSISITTGTYYTWTYGVSATGAATNPDPPTVTASINFGGTNLFIANCGAQNTMASAPANYTSNFTTAGANSAYVSIAAREYASATDNPGTFGTASAAWAANTIVVTGTAPTNPIISHWDATNGGIIVYPSASDTITLRTFGAGATSFTVSGLTAIEYDHLTVTLTGGTITMTIGASSNSTALAAIPNSTANWTFCDGDGVLYVDTISYDQGGAPVSAWEWEYNTTFYGKIEVAPDVIFFTGIDGTPSFRTSSSDSDVTTILSVFGPTEISVATYDPDLDWPSIVTTVPSQPSVMYSENATPGVFFAGLVHAVWPDSTVPESFFWYNFTFATIIIGGILIFRMHQSLILKVIVMMAIMIGWSLPGPNVYGMYVVIYFGFYCLGILIISKSYGW